jgi:hypothetical protein
MTALADHLRQFNNNRGCSPVFSALPFHKRQAQNGLMTVARRMDQVSDFVHLAGKRRDELQLQPMGRIAPAISAAAAGHGAARPRIAEWPHRFPLMWTRAQLDSGFFVPFVLSCYCRLLFASAGLKRQLRTDRCVVA